MVLMETIKLKIIFVSVILVLIVGLTFFVQQGYVVKDLDQKEEVVIQPLTLTEEQEQLKKEIEAQQDKRLQDIISNAEKNGGGLAQDVNGGLE